MTLLATRRTDLTIDGLRLAVFEQGSGEPVLLLHGYPQSHDCWNAIIPILAKTHRIIAPDWFGWGESERSLTAPAGYEADVARLGLLLDALHLDRVNLLTHDYGGLIGLGFSVAHPERISRLALINTRAHLRMTPFTFVQWWLFTWIARAPLLRSLFGMLPWRWMHGLALDRYVSNGSFSSDQLDRYLAWMGGPEKAWFVHFCRHFRVHAHPELAAGARHLSMPVAVVWGDRDPYFHFSIAEDLRRRIPHSTLARIADGDHYILEEKPERVLPHLLALLAEPT